MKAEKWLQHLYLCFAAGTGITAYPIEDCSTKVIHFAEEFNHDLVFPGGSAGKESAGNTGGLGSIPGLGRSLGEGKGNPVQWLGEFFIFHYVSCSVVVAEVLSCAFLPLKTKK